MKILFANIIYPTPHQSVIVGGAEISVKALAETLSRMGHSVAVIRGRGPGFSYGCELIDGVAVYSVNICNYYWPFGIRTRGRFEKALWHSIDDMGITSVAIGKIMDDFRPDVVHTNNLVGLTTGVWREAAKRRIPIMHVLRDYYLMCARSTRFRNGAICARKCGECRLTTMKRSRMTGLVNGVVGNSKAILDAHFKAGLFPNAKFKTNIANIAEARRVSFNTRGETLRFGFIGRTSAEKGLALLASAFGKVKADCELVIAGGLSEDGHTALRVLAGRPIRVLGFVKPDDFYSQVDIVVVPSLWAEPLPRAVLEAYSYGLAVIGSNRGGIPEAVGNDGAGWIFDPADETSLSSIMQELCDNPELVEVASLNAVQRAKSFSSEHIGQAHIAALAQIIDVE